MANYYAPVILLLHYMNGPIYSQTESSAQKAQKLLYYAGVFAVPTLPLAHAHGVLTKQRDCRR